MGKTTKVTRLVSHSALTAVLAITMFGTKAAWGDETHDVEYLGGAEALAVADGNIFSHIDSFVPGDESTGTVRISNSGHNRVRVWCWAESEFTGNEELLSALQIAIVNSSTGKTIYAGALHPDGWNEPIALGDFAPGDGTELFYTLGLPIECGNEFMDMNAAIEWSFGVEEIDANGNPVNSGGDGSNSVASIKDRLAQTGDENGALMLSVLCIAVAAGAVAIVVARRRRKDEEADDERH